MAKGLMTIEGTGIDLEIMGAKIPGDITFEQAGDAIALLTRLGNSARWALADVIAMSVGSWSESYIHLIDSTQLSQGTLQNILYVWRRFPTIESRQWDVSFSHYTACSPDYLTDEDRAAILQQAVDEGLSREQTRDIVRGYGPEIVIPTFSKEAFVTRLDHLLDWAAANGAPEELLDTVREMFSDFKKESEWD